MRNAGWIVAMGLAACGQPSSGSLDAPASRDSAPVVDAPKPGTPEAGSLAIIEEMIPNVLTLTAEFADFPAMLPTAGDLRVDGPCTIRRASSAARVSAGTVTITNGADVVTLAPNAMNGYSAQQQGLHYADGAALAIAASGSTVPAFSAGLTFPPPITVTSPEPGMLSKTGYSVTWTGTGPMRIMIAQSPISIVCDYTTSPATIAASSLSDLVAGTGSSMQVALLIGGRANMTVSAGDYDLDLEALSLGYDTVTFVQ